MRRRIRWLLAAVAVALLAMMLGASPASATGTRTTDFTPYYGGDQIQPFPGGGTQCGGWFIMHHGSSGAYSATANQCHVGTYEVGTTGIPWGATEHWNYTGDTNADVQLDKLSFAGDKYVYADPTANHRQVYNWETTNQDVLGNTVCLDGQSSGEVCGAVIVNTNYTATSSDGKVWQHQVQVRCPIANIACNGVFNEDVGSPVYAVFSSGAHSGEVEAMGMIIEQHATCVGSTCNQYVSFSPVRFMMPWFQATDPGINLLCDLCTDS